MADITRDAHQRRRRLQSLEGYRRHSLARRHNLRQLGHVLLPAQYRLTVKYLRTETTGPLFEYMKARLSGIASHSGMSKVFKLEGADVYCVEEVITAYPATLLPKRRGYNRLSALKNSCTQLSESHDLANLIDTLLASLESGFGIKHSMVLMFDNARQKLYTLSSRGYAESGVGAEVNYGEGIIGVAAKEQIPIRIGHMAREYLYSRAVREQISESDSANKLETEIPFSGIPESRSQLAVPVVFRKMLLGVLYVESPEDSRFD